MPRSSSRKIKKKKRNTIQNQNTINELLKGLTEKGMAEDLLYTIKTNFNLAAAIGRSINLAIGFVKAELYDYESDFDLYVANACELAITQVDLSVYDGNEDDYPIEVVAPMVLQILANAGFVKGLHAGLVPKISHGEFTIDISSKPSEIELTDVAEEFLSKVDCEGDLDLTDEDLEMYSNLAIEYMQKIVDKYKDQ